MNRLIRFVSVVVLLLFTSFILVMTIHGIPGNPNEQTMNLLKWTDNGPFELSPDRGRFALMYSVVENHSFHFSVPVARFAVPDLGYKNGYYVSLFAPFLSFIIIPGYLLGKMFGIAQVGAFAVISLFAILNTLLIRSIAIRLGANKIAATIASLTFLFATPAFAYAVSLYQHHVSTFLLLLSIYLFLRWDTFWSLAGIWFLFALGVPVDNPNFFFMTPVALMAAWRIINVQKERVKYVLNIRFFRIFSLLLMLIPLGFFLWTNYMSYGNPLQLAGTVGGVRQIGADGKPAASKTTSVISIDAARNPDKQKKDAVGFFKTRNLINGMYIHFISPDRGMVYFTPVILLGIFGGIVLYRKNKKLAALLIAVIGMNVLLYSLWGDPWGGWAFGSRYLIPTYAVLAILLSIALTTYRRNIFFMALFILLLLYSVNVNTIGALTSNANPPQVEVLALEKLSGHVQKYTYERDLDMLKFGQSKSFMWQTYFSTQVSALEYYQIILGSILVPLLALITVLALMRKEKYVEAR